MLGFRTDLWFRFQGLGLGVFCSGCSVEAELLWVLRGRK